MARPTNKTELISFSENEFNKLIQYISLLSDQQRDKEFVFDNRTSKDIVAHVYAWQLLELDWYTKGMNNITPDIPAKGFSFKDTPKLNEKLFQDYKNFKWKKLNNEFKSTHTKLLNIIKSHTKEELFTKKLFKWTGSTDMAIYFRSALSSHYLWASDLIRKHFKLKIEK